MLVAVGLTVLVAVGLAVLVAVGLAVVDAVGDAVGLAELDGHSVSSPGVQDGDGLALPAAGLADELALGGAPSPVR